VASPPLFLTTADWALHGIVMGVLVGLAGAFTLVDRMSPSRGGWISLRGIASFFVWIFVACYAAASSVTFVFSPLWGPVASYLAALPLVGVGWAIYRAMDRLKERRLFARALPDLLGRFELLSWSPETPGPGRLRLQAEIRALRELRVRFHGSGLDAAGQPAQVFERPKAVSLKAGETARLVLEIPVTPDRPMVDYVLEFWTWTDGDPEDGPTQGVLSYERIGADLQDGVCLLRRPLPSPTPSG